MSRAAADPRRASEALGHDFADPALLDTALTHASAATPARPSNQRLEFLGDRVLGLLVAELLLARHPEAAEGELAPRLNELVRKETCAEVARAAGLDRALRLGPGEARSGARRRDAVLGDAAEAALAAVFLDGGIDAARAVVARHWGPRLEGQGAETPRDAKTALQEWAQARGLKPPRYLELERRGPDHAPRFLVAARLETGAEAQAEAGSKRAAEQEAAATLLRLLEAADE